MTRVLTRDETEEFIDDRPAWWCLTCPWEGDEEPPDGRCPACGSENLDFAVEGAC